MASSDATGLPDDVHALRQMVVAMQEQLAEKDTALKAEKAKAVGLSEQLALLKQQLIELRRARYGRRCRKT